MFLFEIFIMLVVCSGSGSGGAQPSARPTDSPLQTCANLGSQPHQERPARELLSWPKALIAAQTHLSSAEWEPLSTIKKGILESVGDQQSLCIWGQEASWDMGLSVLKLDGSRKARTDGHPVGCWPLGLWQTSHGASLWWPEVSSLYHFSCWVFVEFPL